MIRPGDADYVGATGVAIHLAREGGVSVAGDVAALRASSRASSLPQGVSGVSAGSLPRGIGGVSADCDVAFVRAELAREDLGSGAGDIAAVKASSRASSLPQGFGGVSAGLLLKGVRRWAAAAVLALGFAGVAQAAIDAYTFKDDAERARYTELTRELRCPKCQNQDIADSNAPIAADLRKEIYRMLGEGRSNQQIIDFMVDRYGEFVRYKPELNAHTWLLWFGPAGLLLVGAVLIGVIVVRRRRSDLKDADVLSDEERQRLAHLLDKNRE
jgi:cytochrome c-type biogenesis protein CcmH